MSVTVLTAMVIRSREVRCEAGGPAANGKYAGWVLLDEDRWHPLLSTEPVYDSENDAVDAMRGLVAGIRGEAPEGCLAVGAKN